MCGIAGYIGIENLQKERLDRTLHLMKNRGPDSCGVYKKNSTDKNVYLLHSRLSIIDLEERANQPFSLGKYTLVFNGEIYNYLEVREELVKKGVSFRSESDTEVLLQAYIAYGKECVKKLEGMWAFAIYNCETAELFLSRDRFSEKPLYFHQTENGFYWGSEIKFIHSLLGRKLPVNNFHLYRYMINGYKSLYKGKETFFKGLGEVPYASNMILADGKKPILERYWTPKSSVIENMSLDDAIEGVRERFVKSMKLRLRSDVPMAFCLSGGIDSAAIVSTAVKCFQYEAATFSIIDSDERYNEAENIQATVNDLGCKNISIHLSQVNFIERMKKLVAYHDVPIYTISYYIHAFLSEAISENGYRLVASGTGADELLTGYYDHFNLHLHEMRDRADYQEYLNHWRENTGKVVRNPFLMNPELYKDNPGFRDHIYLNNDLFADFFHEDFKEEFEESYFCNSLLRNRMMNEMFHETIPVILHEDDLNSMCYSIENRSPYLDTDLFEFSNSIPARHLIRDGYAKYVLREAMKGILNEKVRTDRQKKGFNASINSLVSFDEKDVREYLLDDSPVFDLIKKERVEEALSRKPMENSFSKFVFNFINTKMFLETAAEN